MTEVTIYGGGGMEQYPYLFDEKYRNKFFTQSNFYGGGTRAVHPYGQVSLTPCTCTPATPATMRSGSPM